jgi:hypothetical protein
MDCLMGPAPLKQSNSKRCQFASVAEPRDAMNQRARLQDLGVLDPEVRLVRCLRVL